MNVDSDCVSRLGCTLGSQLGFKGRTHCITLDRISMEFSRSILEKA